MNSISTTCTAEINVIDEDVDVGTNATTWLLLMDSDLKSLCAVVHIQLFVTIAQKLGTFKIVFLILGCKK